MREIHKDKSAASAKHSLKMRFHMHRLLLRGVELLGIEEESSGSRSPCTC